jgi:Domain of unknown function (DUF5655)
MPGSGPEDVDVWTVERHLEGLPNRVIDLYERFILLVQQCGPFEYHVTKSAIALKGVRRGFAGAKPKPQWLDGFLDLQREVRDGRIRRVSPYTKRLFVHQFRIIERNELDASFALWIREAYDVGAGQHL